MVRLLFEWTTHLSGMVNSFFLFVLVYQEAEPFLLLWRAIYPIKSLLLFVFTFYHSNVIRNIKSLSVLVRFHVPSIVQGNNRDDVGDVTFCGNRFSGCRYKHGLVPLPPEQALCRCGVGISPVVVSKQCRQNQYLCGSDAYLLDCSLRPVENSMETSNCQKPDKDCYVLPTGMSNFCLCKSLDNNRDQCSLSTGTWSWVFLLLLPGSRHSAKNVTSLTSRTTALQTTCNHPVFGASRL